MVSGVDEENQAYASLSPSELVLALAITKAHTVKQSIDFPALVIGCDSTFEFEGESLGNQLPASERSRERNYYVENLASFIPDIALLIPRRKLK